jgi:hypothetical protein
VKSFKRSDYNVLVTLFLKNTNNINYPKEYALAKKLLSTYDDFSFWKGTLLESKRRVLNSLAYFLTEDGKLFLKNSFFYHLKRKDVNIDAFKTDKPLLEKEKVGEKLRKTSTKKLSILDFIKNDS